MASKTRRFRQLIDEILIQPGNHDAECGAVKGVEQRVYGPPQ